MDQLTSLTIADLLDLHVEVLDELRNRHLLRTANNLTGDLAEFLFCEEFGWARAPNSEKSFDARSADGTKFQIKGRRLDKPTSSRQLSAIRDVDGFDVLAGVLFDRRFNVTKAALVPNNVIRSIARFQKHTNSHVFHLSDAIWEAPGVEDVTAKLQNAAIYQG